MARTKQTARMSTGGKVPTREHRIEELQREKRIAEEELRRHQNDLLQLQEELYRVIAQLNADQLRQVLAVLNPTK